MKALVNVFRFEPSSLTYVIILFLKPYASKRLMNFLANVYPIVLAASNESRVFFFKFQLNPKKIMTKANTSCAHVDIHKSKLAITQ